MSFIIGIGGVSRSGKSSLAQKIKDRLSDRQVLLLDMDDFVFSASDIPKINGKTDWERPESVDFNQILSEVQNSRRNYDIIIVEGILAFANDALRSGYDLTIQIQLSKETFLLRRKKEQRWGDEPDWYLEHVWDSYLKWGQFQEADMQLSGEEELSESLLSSLIKEIISRQ
ncbi:hypothetical protein [Ekhidna sp.]|uniref:uridine kinase family protein n=1 Tax=Ekhidna sp. TaxID=2608089 RepID=UPI003299D17E